MQIALYKGPPSSILHKISHCLIKFWTRSEYSHAELVINGICYSSSSRDGGVRSKKINIKSGRWDVFDITDDKQIKAKALSWFVEHDGDSYDYRNIFRYVIPLIGHNENHWVCFEAIGAALGIKDPHKLDADDLMKEALKLEVNHEYN